ncbi:MAG: hypothetical protein Q8O01_05590 [Candidatus Omnitrophota bacterium]|nr:hypothetical protein [Candidatus Omnitrophota bacterium]
MRPAYSLSQKNRFLVYSKITVPGRFMMANAATLVTKIIGKAVRDGKTCYYVDDGIYHTFLKIGTHHFSTGITWRIPRGSTVVITPPCRPDAPARIMLSIASRQT